MPVTLLERRRIEAEFIKSLLETMAATVGREQAVAWLGEAIRTMAERAGAAFAGQRKREQADLIAYADILPIWQENDALRLEIEDAGADHLAFNVVTCRYADMYRELGLADLGALLSCNRDAAFCAGFNPAIILTRTQTIMEGADHCDFRYVLKDMPPPERSDEEPA